MSTLSRELDRYLTIRRGLGYDLGTAERILRGFTAFAEHEGADLISTDLFLRWQEVFGHANRHTWSRRLSMVRLFAQWMHGMDQRHEVPPQALIPGRQCRPRPYIYSEDEICRIVEAAAELPSINGIRALTCSTLFGLIAVTGLRVSEALSLDVADVDLEAGLVISRSTARKSSFASRRSKRPTYRQAKPPDPSGPPSGGPFAAYTTDSFGRAATGQLVLYLNFKELRLPKSAPTCITDTGHMQLTVSAVYCFC
jgi:integrase